MLLPDKLLEAVSVVLTLLLFQELVDDALRDQFGGVFGVIVVRDLDPLREALVDPVPKVKRLVSASGSTLQVEEGISSLGVGALVLSLRLLSFHCY